MPEFGAVDQPELRTAAALGGADGVAGGAGCVRRLVAAVGDERRADTENIV
jgi:hypothetical protein